MSDRDRRRQSPSEDNRDRDRQSRDQFGRDESRRANYGSSYPESGTGCSGSNHRNHDQQRQKSPSPNHSPTSRRGSRGRSRFRDFRSHPGSGSSKRTGGKSFNFSKNNWTQPAEGHARRDLKTETSARSGANVDPEALQLYRKLRNYVPYLQKRSLQITKEKKERQFADQLDNIKFYLDAARDINSDATLGAIGIKNIIDRITEMVRKHPIKEDENRQEVIDVSSGGEDNDLDDHADTSCTKQESPRRQMKSNLPQPPHPPIHPRPRKGAFPKAHITTNWNYDPSNPEPEDEDEDEEPPLRQEAREVDREYCGHDHAHSASTSSTSSSNNRNSNREQGREQMPPPQTLSDPATPNLRQTHRRLDALSAYDPFAQLSDDDDEGNNAADDLETDFHLEPNSPTVAQGVGEDFDAMFHRPQRRLTEEPIQAPSGSPALQPQEQFPPPREFAPIQHGFHSRHVYNQGNNRVLPEHSSQHEKLHGSAATMTPRDMQPPEIPLVSRTNLIDPRLRPPQRPVANGHDPRMNAANAASTGNAADPRYRDMAMPKPPPTDPRLARINSAAAATAAMNHAPPPTSDPRYRDMAMPKPPPTDPRLARINNAAAATAAMNHVPLPTGDPRLGPQRATAYANQATGVALQPMQQMQQQRTIDPAVAAVAHFTNLISSGMGLTQEQIEVLKRNLLHTAAAAAVGPLPGMPPPPMAMPPLQFGTPYPHPQQQHQFVGVQEQRHEFAGPCGPQRISSMGQQPQMTANNYTGTPSSQMMPPMHRQPMGGISAAAPSSALQDHGCDPASRAKANAWFSRQNRHKNRFNSRRSNNFNSKRFQGPSWHGAPNRFPFKQNIRPRESIQDQARRREREAIDRERELGYEEARLKKKKWTDDKSSSSTSRWTESTGSSYTPTTNETPLIATNQVPATISPDANREALEQERNELEQARQRVQDKLAALPQPIKRSKLDLIREQALKTMLILPQSVAARGMLTAKAKRNPSNHPKSPSPAPATESATATTATVSSNSNSSSKVQELQTKRRRISSSSNSDGRKVTSATDCDEDASRDSVDMEVGDNEQAAPAPAEEPEPSTPGKTPPPPPGSTTGPEPTTPAGPVPPAPGTSSVPKTSKTSAGGKRSGSRDPNDIHANLRGMNFEASMPLEPQTRRRPNAAAGEVSKNSSSFSGCSHLSSVIKPVSKGKNKPASKPKAPPKPKMTPAGATSAAGQAVHAPATGNGQTRKGAKTSPKNTKKKTKSNSGLTTQALLKLKAPRRPAWRPNQKFLDQMAASEVASAIIPENQKEIQDIGISSLDGVKSTFGGVVIGRNDLLVNPALGKIKMESDYDPTLQIKTEPPESPVRGNYSGLNFGSIKVEDDDDDDDDDEEEKYQEVE